MNRNIKTAAMVIAISGVIQAWTVREGADQKSGVPYATASQHADGTDHVLGFECQRGQDAMVGVLFNEKMSRNAVYPPRRLEFRVGKSPPMTFVITPMRTNGGDLIYNLRVSERPKDADKALMYLYDKKGDLVVIVEDLLGKRSETIIFRDDNRASIMDNMFSLCGVVIKR